MSKLQRRELRGEINVASRLTEARARQPAPSLTRRCRRSPLPLWLLGLPAATLFLTAGIGHFREPAKFVGIMKGMPLERWHPAANYITGAAELWLGAELAIAPLLGAHHASQIARALFWLVLLMSPANFNMWYNDVPFGDQRLTYGWTGTHALCCARRCCYSRRCIFCEYRTRRTRVVRTTTSHTAASANRATRRQRATFSAASTQRPVAGGERRWRPRRRGRGRRALRRAARDRACPSRRGGGRASRAARQTAPEAGPPSQTASRKRRRRSGAVSSASSFAASATARLCPARPTTPSYGSAAAAAAAAIRARPRGRRTPPASIRSPAAASCSASRTEAAAAPESSRKSPDPTPPLANRRRERCRRRAAPTAPPSAAAGCRRTPLPWRQRMRGRRSGAGAQRVA